VRANDILNRVEKFTDWGQFQSLASEQSPEEAKLTLVMK
jgi:hypothetical protein